MLKGFKAPQRVAHQFKQSAENGASTGIHLATGLTITRLSRRHIFSSLEFLLFLSTFLSFGSSAYLLLSLLESRQRSREGRDADAKSWSVESIDDTHPHTHTCALIAGEVWSSSRNK